MKKDEMLSNMIMKFGFEAPETLRFANMMAVLTTRGAAVLYKHLYNRPITIDDEEEGEE